MKEACNIEERLLTIKKTIDRGAEAGLDRKALMFCLDVTKKLVDRLLVDLQADRKPVSCMMIKHSPDVIQSAESGGLT